MILELYADQSSILLFRGKSCVKGSSSEIIFYIWLSYPNTILYSADIYRHGYQNVKRNAIHIDSSPSLELVKKAINELTGEELKIEFGEEFQKLIKDINNDYYYECPLCKSKMNRKSGQFGDFFACSRWSQTQCKGARNLDGSIPKKILLLKKESSNSNKHLKGLLDD